MLMLVNKCFGLLMIFGMVLVGRSFWIEFMFVYFIIVIGDFLI